MCLAQVVHVSLPYSRMLRTQALYTRTLVFSVSAPFSHTLLVSLDMAEEALPMRLVILTSVDRLLVMVEPK